MLKRNARNALFLTLYLTLAFILNEIHVSLTNLYEIYMDLIQRECVLEKVSITLLIC